MIQSSNSRSLVNRCKSEPPMRTEFSLPELDRLSSHLFAWHWLPSSGSTGHSGGILLGVKDATFEVGSMDRGRFFVSMELYERALNFKWEVIIVYSPADHSRSASFLEELHRKVSAASLPVVVGGDFNLLRFADDKSNSNVNFARMQMFNDCIADLGLREIDRIGARFTRTNRQASPTQSVLDRVLVSPEWDLRCSLASLRAITRIGSDHVPLLLSFANERSPVPPPPDFGLRHSGCPKLVSWRRL
uniref:Endonuclease/exonuclease/phosphatase domain-containing protein n=4 Tax=Aegilops tauschii subsp. strangulata TaxID=200361 RepID=A0A453EX03_AEGTS